MEVHKFGGAALADAEAISRVADILATRDRKRRRLVVTSAVKGITDMLVGILADSGEVRVASAGEKVAQLFELHLALSRRLLSGEHQSRYEATLRTLIGGLRAHLAVLDKNPRLSDAVLAVGERLAAPLLAAVLAARGIEAVVIDPAELIRTDDRVGDAAPNLALTDALVPARLEPLFAQGNVIIVPGFIGATSDGVVTTLGRSGSDMSATILARALAAPEVILWKDVRGMMSADPRVVPDARVVPLIDAREASELAYYGAKILHPRTLAPLKVGMTLRLKPFAHPEEPGTTIVVGKAARGTPVRAISGVRHQAMVTVAGTGMLGVPGVAARLFGVLAGEHISVSLISQASSEQSICFTIPSETAPRVESLLRAAFASDLARGEVEEISVRYHLCTVAVVGSGMAHTPGVSARIFAAVADARVNVVAIAQGASERNVSFVVEEAEASAAIRAVHAAFHLGKLGGGRAVRRADPADVILLGMGRVARELAQQIAVHGTRQQKTFRIVGMIDRTGFVHQPRGLTPREIERLVLLKKNGDALGTAPKGRYGTALQAVEVIGSHALVNPVLVDVASGDTAATLARGLALGMDLVLANKVPLSSGIAWTRDIFQAGRASGRKILHEATVGAGLPLIDTLQQLGAAGDRVDSVDCSPSGTMGFLFSELGRGRKFSDVVKDAMSRGYTEPDPRDDLCGLDVARKGIILARMLGYTGEMEDVAIESLVPPELSAVPRVQFLEALPFLDNEWSARVASAREQGEVLRYRARATRGGVKVGLASVPVSHALASLDGTDNLFVITTSRYRERPLVISGPGAGVEVTAGGVLGDLLRLVGA